MVKSHVEEEKENIKQTSNKEDHQEQKEEKGDTKNKKATDKKKGDQQWDYSLTSFRSTVTGGSIVKQKLDTFRRWEAYLLNSTHPSQQLNVDINFRIHRLDTAVDQIFQTIQEVQETGVPNTVGNMCQNQLQHVSWELS